MTATSEKQVRHIEFSRAAMDKKKRTIVCTLATENEVKRSYAAGEILLCGTANVNMERAEGGLSVLLNHDTSKIVGITTRVYVASDGTVKAEIQFGNTPLANEAWQNVEDGVLRYVSVGYTIERATENDAGVITATSWTPMEISLVAVPADPKAVLGRKNSTQMNTQTADYGKDSIRALAAQYAERHPDKKEIINHRASVMELEGKPVTEFQRFLLDDILRSDPIPNGDEPVTHTRDASTSTSNTWRAPGNIQITETLGDAFIRSADYAKFKRGDLRGRRNINIECRGTLPQHLQRATLTTSGLTSIHKIPGVVLLDQQPPRVAELFSNGTTGNSTIRYTRETAYVNAATGVLEEGLKPSATFTLDEEDVGVIKQAVIGKVSDEQLADHDYTSSYITGRMAFMLASLEDSELLTGAGGASLTGILNVSGILSQATAGAASPIDAAYKALTKIRTTAFLEPEAYIFNPLDWENFVLTKDGNGQYISGGPFPSGAYGAGRMPAEMLWGKPVILSTAMTRGTALAGAFRMGATIFRRQGLTIDSTNSNEDDFKRNLTCFRAEQRLCLVPFRPSAFCQITGIPQVGA